MSVEFDFTASGEEGFTFSASGTITATLVSNGAQTEYVVDSISGTVNGVQISGLEAPGVHGGYGDNDVYTPGPFLDNSGINFTTVDGNQYNLSYFETVRRLPIYYVGADDSSGNPIEAADGPISFTLTPVCFVIGTLIRTTQGELPVQNLRVGDEVVTASGEARPIRWLGHRKLECLRHPDPCRAWPVRISAHAFGDHKPTRDLFVSPGHSLCIDVVEPVLIPAGALLNNTTIKQVEMNSVEYWHIELDEHDVLFANNLPAESYLNMGNRDFFVEADIIDLAASPDIKAPPRATADFCRPFHGSGKVVEVVRDQLRARAQQIGWRLEQNDFGDFHLVVDGQRSDPVRQGLSACFALPAQAQEVYLASDAVRPCDIKASSDDRLLGVCIRRIMIIGAWETRELALDDARLDEGFSFIERNDAGVWRWTTGRARLPRALWSEIAGPLLLRVDIDQALPRWVAPAHGLAPRRLSEIGHAEKS